MTIVLDLQIAVENEQDLPTYEDISLWLNSTLAKFQPQC